MLGQLKIQNVSKISRTLAVAVGRKGNFYDVIRYEPKMLQ
jgi:hypothetical protein